ncbi:MAG: hypothetical protein NVSMB54_16690 [Ktedonobacteraceae bacterium]
MVKAVSRNKTLNWYEASLSSHERKVRGHFSTPPLLVNAILDACGYTADANLAKLRVLDPACGSGNFLAGAAQRLLAYGTQRKIHPHQLLTSLQRNLWGFDPDPIACFLAEMQLHILLVEQDMAHDTQGKQHLHIHQADGLALPWAQEQCETIDLFLANPPYLAAKNTDLSGYRSMQAFGQADSYLLFLRLALQVVRPNGWIGLVLPDPVLARANATRERQRLLQETTVHHLWHLSNVFPAYVGAVIIIAQKCPPTPVHQITWMRTKWSRREEKTLQVRHTLSPSCIPQQLLHAQEGAELRYLLGNEQETLVDRLHTCMTKGNKNNVIVPLNSIVSIRRGEELGKKSVLFVNNPPKEEGWHPLLLGGVDVRPYAPPQGQYWIAEKMLGKPLARYSAPKLLVVKSTKTLQAALDTQGHVVLQTLYLLTLHGPVGLSTESEDITEHGESMSEEAESTRRGGMSERGESMTGASPVTTILPSSPRSGETVYSSDRACPCHAPTAPTPAALAFSSSDTLYFLLALLNSRLLQHYVYVLHTAYKLVQPQIEQHVLARLPIPTVVPERQHDIAMRAKQIMLACSDASPVVELKQQLYEEQERAICALYEYALHL